METILDFLRHGEPAGGKRYRGHGVDDPLSELGWEQMWAAVTESDRPWSRVVSSPMRRCLAFAEAIAERQGLPLTVDERFKEVGFGAWEGRRHEEVRAADPHGYIAFYRDPVGARPAGSEPLTDFVARVHAAIDATLAQYAGEHVLVVAHAGVLRAAILAALHVPLSAMYRIDVPFAGRLRLVQGERGLELGLF